MKNRFSSTQVVWFCSALIADESVTGCSFHFTSHSRAGGPAHDLTVR